MVDVVFLGPKSPPVSGYSNIVGALYKVLLQEIESISFINTVPSFLSVLYPGKLWRLFRFVYLICLLPYISVKAYKAKVIYLNLNGGMGLLFDLAVVFWAGKKGKTLYLHHNSFSYINASNKIAELIFQLSRINSTHIVSTRHMGEKLMSLYSGVQCYKAVSNAAILNLGEVDLGGNVLSETDTSQKLFIGFMGYFDQYKGLDLFCEVLGNLSKDYSVQGLAVGPVHDPIFYGEIQKKSPRNIEYRGPVYGEEKDAFFKKIDLLLFPSKYPNESEPLVIHHALSYGVPVIATDSGCIGDILEPYAECSSYGVEDYVESAVRFIVDNYLDASSGSKASVKSKLIDEYALQCRKESQKLVGLVDRIKGHAISLKQRD